MNASRLKKVEMRAAVLIAAETTQQEMRQAVLVSA